jgi:hypothetical protein
VSDFRNPLRFPSGSGSASAEQHGHPVDFLHDGHFSSSDAGPRAADSLRAARPLTVSEHGPASSSRESSSWSPRPGASSASEAVGTVPLDTLHGNGIPSLSSPVSGAENDPNLGIYAESSPPLINQSLTKGEKWDWEASLVERYALQSVAREAMLEAFYRIPEGDRPKRAHKVTMCRRWLRPSAQNPSRLVKPAIFRHRDTGNTFYAGHQICASGRACPLCSAKIGEGRAKEIRAAVRQWVHDGGICLFVTLTVPHYVTDSLADLLGGFQEALKRFRKGASFDRLKAALGYEGLIRALETTWGQENGWHPHSHEIWFVRPGEGFDLDALRVKLYERWKASVLAAGLPEPSFRRGLDIKIAETEEQTRERLAEYMAKTGLKVDENAPVWGVDDELVKVHSKRGKPGRYTPFDFLREQYNPETDDAAKARFRRLFAEFVEEFRGVAQVYWSPGLKARFDLEEVSDEQHAQEGEEPSSHLSDVHPHVWAFVIGVKDHRAELLKNAKEGGWPCARAYLDDLLGRYYLDHFQDDFDRLSADARYLLSLPEDSFVSISGDTS